MRKLLQEFREFAVRGNVIDLAVGVIIGAAFGRIVSSLVDDIIMPPISMLMGPGKYADAVVVLRPAITAANGAVTQQAVLLKYGHFLQVVLEFLIVAFCVFMLVRAVNRLSRKKEEAPVEAPLTRQEEFLRDIRDSLRKQ